MYFKNKFNKEIQTIVRNIPVKDTTSTLSRLDKNLWKVESYDFNTLKIIPLLIHEKYSSSNNNDKVYENNIVVANNRSKTKLTIGKKR